MGKEIRGLKSISTLRKLRTQSSSAASKQLELYLLDNNMALLEKELSSMEKRKKKIEDKLNILKENKAALEGISPGKKRKKRASASPAKRGSIKVMKINY